MKALTKLLFVLAVLFVMVGCATSGPKFTELSPTISALAPDSGRIYFYRVSALGAAVQPDVKLNGETIGSAVPDGFFYIDKPSGTYEVSTKTEVERKLSLTLDNGQIRFVRFNISMGFFVGHVNPELVEPGVGGKEIQNLRYTGQQKL